MNNDQVWSALRKANIIKPRDIDADVYHIVARYMSEEEIQHIISKMYDDNRHMFLDDYRKCMETELLERSLLGKKMLELPK